MLIKRGDGKIIDIIKDVDETFNETLDEKTKKALQDVKNIAKDGNKIDCIVEAEKN